MGSYILYYALRVWVGQGLLKNVPVGPSWKLQVSSLVMYFG